MDRLPNLSMMKNNTAVKNLIEGGCEPSLNISYNGLRAPGKERFIPITEDTRAVKSSFRYAISKKKTKLFYYQLIPYKINNDFQQIEAEVKLQIKGYQADYLRQMISIVAWHIRKDMGYARLNMKYLKAQVPQGDKYMHELVVLGIVIKGGQPVKGVKCFEYSFAPEWDSKYIPIPLYNQMLIRRIALLRAKIEKEHRKTIRGHAKQDDYLKQLTIDESFYEYMESEWEGNNNQYRNIMASATRITNHDYFCKRDPTSRRLHSNVTNMAKVLRKYLRVDGKTLINIDIKNSQPYLSTLLLTHPEKAANFAKDDELKNLLKEIKITGSRDITHYIELVTTGKIYEYLVDEFSKEELVMDRKASKRQMLRTLYAKNRKPKDPDNRKAREIFVRLFPNVHKIFSKIRGRGKGEKYKTYNNKFKTYKRFAILLQRIESHLVLDVIMKRVYTELPKIFVLTIHDSLLTINDSKTAEAIQKIMHEELEKFVGFAPITVIE